MEPVGAHARFACHEQKGRPKPNVQRGFRRLYNRANRDIELLAAGIALMEIGAARRTLKLLHAPLPGEPQRGQTGPFD